MAKDNNKPSLVGRALFGVLKAGYSLCVLPVHGALYKWGDAKKRPAREQAIKKRLPWAAGAAAGLILVIPTCNMVKAKIGKATDAMVEMGGKAADGIKKAVGSSNETGKSKPVDPRLMNEKQQGR